MNLKNSVSAEVADWSRERKDFFEWNPGKSLLASIRAYQYLAQRNSVFYIVLKKLAVLRHRFWSVVSGADIPLNCELGGGLLIPHPNGIVLHSKAKIGPNCLILQQVTIGNGNGGVPILGGHVDVGAGAKILGDVRIGNHSVIGANAVVLSNVADYQVAVGVPAKMLQR